MLALRKSSHSRVVAFIVVLAMILMYTFAFAPVAFAGPNDELQLQIKDHPNAEDIIIPDYDYVAMKVQMLIGSETVTGIDIAPKNKNQKYFFDFKNISGSAVEFTKDQSWTYMGIAFFSSEQSIPALYAYEGWISVTKFLSGTPGTTNVFLGKVLDTLPTTGSITIGKDVLAADESPTNDAIGVFNFTITGPDDFTTSVALKDGESKSYTLPFGTYTVIEDAHQDYNQDTTQTALTIDDENLSESYTFLNYQKSTVDPPQPDLDLSKKVNGLDVLTGAAINDQVVFTIALTNTGAGDAEGKIIVRDLWPYEYVSMTSIDVPDGSIYQAIEVNDIRWSFDGLAAGDTIVMTISAIITSFPAQGPITNEAQVMEDGDRADAEIFKEVITPDPDPDPEPRPRPRPTPVTIEEVPVPEAPAPEPEVVIVPDPAPLADVPQTGINDNAILYAGMLLGSLAGITALARRRKSVSE
jgi:LPXTG-motif cell wall-anchored protein/uncharacterized repeat protein (TIGR01451 family)